MTTVNHSLHTLKVKTLNNKTKCIRTQKKSWRPNKSPNRWEKLKNSPNWSKLSKIEKTLLQLGWPNRYLQLSYSEIATLLHIQRNAAIRLMQKLEKMGFIEKRKSFIKKKNGSPTKIHKRNYYTFTDVGKAGIEILLNRLFHGQNEPQKNLTIVRKNKPCENLRSQDYLHDEKFLEIKKVFNKYSFENQLFRAYEGTVRILFNYSLEKIEKLLKLMRKKVSKGWKIREFWGFFLKMLKKPKKIQSFFPYLANEYLEAAKGKSCLVTHGIDSRIICESLGKLQKTGESITEGKLARMLLYGTEKLKAALEGICYRSYLGRGTFPEPKAALDESSEIKRRPIKKLIKINARTGKQYTEDDWTSQRDFCLKTIIVGYEDVNRIEKRENTQRVVSQARIQSWVGLLVETLRTCKDCESIYRRYFFSKSNQYA